MRDFFAKIWRRCKRVVLIAFLLHLAYVVFLCWYAPPYTLTMVADLLKGQSVNYNSAAYPVQGNQIKLAALASEDQRFLSHYGIDFKGVKAAIDEKAKGKRLRGGSTISQQTAKNVFLWQGRSWLRKGLEVYTTLLIEIIWGKKRILEYYLHIAEMGKGIYGIQAASKHYYNTTPEKLSESQAAAIITCLPSPKTRDPRRLSAQQERKKNWIIRQMRILKKQKTVKEFLSD